MARGHPQVGTQKHYAARTKKGAKKSDRTIAEHLAFFRELAQTCPDTGMPPLPDLSSKPDVSAWKEYKANWDAWTERAKRRSDLLLLLDLHQLEKK
jgi:hypothetical protein